MLMRPAVILSCLIALFVSEHQGARPSARLSRAYQLAADEGVFAYSRISPDGRLLAYASETKRGQSRIAVDRTVTVVDLATRKVIFSEPGVDAYWSPDGRRLIFLSEKDGLARVSIRSVDGAISRDVAPVQLGGYFSWGVRDRRDLILTITGNFFYLEGDRAVLPAERVPECGAAVDRPLLSKDGARITTFVRGTLVVRNLSDCSAIFETGVGGAKADFSWNGRYIAFHAPKQDGSGYEIDVVDLELRTIRTITDLPGSGFFPSWTEDGRLSFRYDAPDYHGFIIAEGVLSAPERPLGPRDQRVPDRVQWSDIFPETPTPRGAALVTVWGTWSAHSPSALQDLQRIGRDPGAADERLTVLTAADIGSAPTDIARVRARYGITVPQIPLDAQRLPLTQAQNQIPVTLLFRNGELVGRRLGAQSYDMLKSWLNGSSD
jgi:dipeptidyl aminopeptidase/acylaminoacyl peptidase